MIENMIWFLAGAVVTHIFSYLMTLGRSVLVLDQLQKNVAALFLISEHGLDQVLHLKYLAMQEAQRTDQNIVAQKYIDQMNIDSVKKTIMRNYCNTFPENYKHIMKYATWEEMSQYVEKTDKQEEK